MAKMSFGDISSWADNTYNTITVETSQLAKRVALKLVDNSPVKTGRYVANWKITDSKNITIGEMSENTDKTKVKIKGMIGSTLTPYYFTSHHSFTIYNTATYHDNVESTGWLNTSPYAPVANTISWAMNSLAIT